MLFGEKHTLPVTHVVGMLLAGQNERNVVTYWKKRYVPSPALSLSHSLLLSFPLSRSTSLSPLPLLLRALLSKSKTTYRSPLPAMVSPHTLCKLYIPQKVHTGNGSDSYVLWWRRTLQLPLSAPLCQPVCPNTTSPKRFSLTKLMTCSLTWFVRTEWPDGRRGSEM